MNESGWEIGAHRRHETLIIAKLCKYKEALKIKKVDSYECKVLYYKKFYADYAPYHNISPPIYIFELEVKLIGPNYEDWRESGAHFAKTHSNGKGPDKCHCIQLDSYFKVYGRVYFSNSLNLGKRFRFQQWEAKITTKQKWLRESSRL